MMLTIKNRVTLAAPLRSPSLLLWSMVVVFLMDTIEAYPTLVMPQIYRPMQRTLNDGKSIDLGFPQTDDDVLQLEHLRQVYENQPAYYRSRESNHQHQHQYQHQQHKKDQIISNNSQDDELSSSIAVEDIPNTRSEMEQQVETIATETTPVPPTAPVETPKEAHTIGNEESSSTTGVHRPPHLQGHDGGKMEKSPSNGANDSNDKAKAAAKCRAGLHGAARLMYGQNPEVLPTTASSSTSLAPAIITTFSTTATTTSTGNLHESTSSSAERDDREGKEVNKENLKEDVNEGMNSEVVEEVNANVNGEDKELIETHTDADSGQTMTTVIQDPPHLHPMRPMKMDRKPQIPQKEEEEPARQLIGDVIVDESPLRKPASRRSVPVAVMSPKLAESLLKRAHNGQYSSFDMAQYIFWTGDESGVAHAVGELVQNDVMTREDALKFLHEIRVGLEYLQQSYANRIFPQEIHHNAIKKSHMPSMAMATISPGTTTTTTKDPSDSYMVDVEQRLDERDLAKLGKALESIALWHKRQSMLNENKQSDVNDLVDNADIREMKITNCQDKEYNLEEVIYKLARIMFVQSLSHGSEESQKEIEKLMDFLERERELGVISVYTERKVLHVLLQALSDTLTEKPELWTTAQYLYKRLLHRNTHTNLTDGISI